MEASDEINFSDLPESFMVTRIFVGYFFEERDGFFVVP
jgi:hypothetical protein